MSSANQVVVAAELVRQAKDVIWQLVKTLDRQSPAWTFSSIAYDELLRADLNLKAAANNLDGDNE